METKVAYFISDAHLGVNPPGSIEDREESLVHFLKGMIGGASHLFIVGDLFEFWYEYRHYVARGHMPLYRVLGDLVDSGTEVHYLTGNHDFALGDFFSKELGVQVHRTYVAKNIQGHDIYLMHGDGVAKADKGYRAARKLIDAKWAQFLFRQIHPDLGMDIATFCNIFNEMHVKDTSKKIKASNKIKSDRGQRVASRPPYGYRKSEHDKNMLLPDEETAPVVTSVSSL